MFGIQFYPTPADLVDKMYDKVDWDKVRYILEPSAGKGDLLDGFERYKNRHRKFWYCYDKHIDGKVVFKETFDDVDELLEFVNKEHNLNLKTYDNLLDYIDKCYDNGTFDRKNFINVIDHSVEIKMPTLEIECVEIDESLCEILSGKHYFVNNCDFLNFEKMARYDLILMNPPFKDGDKHLLKALQMIENGGQCVCILNAETIKNPYSDSRQYLCNLLEKYHADIEFISEAFSDGEVKTDVEIALVYVNIPVKTVDIDIVKNMVLGQDYDKDYKQFD